MTDLGKNAKTPSIEESIGGMRELLAIWQVEEKLVKTPIIDNSPDTGLFVRAFAEHTVALTESVALLGEHRMFLQAAPLIRLSMECAITAAWLSVTPNSANALTHEYAVQEKKLFNHRVQLNIPVSTEDLSFTTIEFEELVKYQSSEALQFIERFKAIAGGELLYLPYRQLSEVSHAGLSIKQHYVFENPESTDPEKRLAFVIQPQYFWTDQAFGGQVVSLILALTAWDELAPDKPWSSKIQTIADRFGVIRTIRRT